MGAAKSETFYVSYIFKLTIHIRVQNIRTLPKPLFSEQMLHIEQIWRKQLMTKVNHF